MKVRSNLFVSFCFVVDIYQFATSSKSFNFHLRILPSSTFFLFI